MVGILLNSSLPASPPNPSPLLGLLIAKTGHVVEYALLGWLVWGALTEAAGGVRLRPMVALGLTVLVGALFAGLDEVRQLFVYSRTGQATDVLIDAVSLTLVAAIRTRKALAT